MKSKHICTPCMEIIRFDHEDVITTSGMTPDPTRFMTLSGYGNGGLVGDAMITLGGSNYQYTDKRMGGSQVDDNTMLSAIISFFGLSSGSVKLEADTITTLENLRMNGEKYDHYNAFNGVYSTYTYDDGVYVFQKSTTN